MRSLNIMLKPASSQCNMRCKYCFYDDVSNHREVHSRGKMSENTVDAILNTIRSELDTGDRVHFIFQGGEPTLSGMDFFARFVSKASILENISVSYALQTNSLLLDREWCVFLKKHDFLVGISMDILREAHDNARVLPSGEGTYSTALERIALLKEYGVKFNVLCTLTREIACQPREVWEQLKAIGIDFVQFTPCLGSLNSSILSEHALTPQLFASFYTELFGYWYDDFRKGNGRSVKLFDDVVNQLITGFPTTCGMDGLCRPQIVVEADGSVYPCDFYCLDEFKLGSISRQKISEMLASPSAIAFTEREHNLPTLCYECAYTNFCHGNCKRAQSVACCEPDGEFCGYKAFLDRCGNTLRLIARTARNQIYPEG